MDAESLSIRKFARALDVADTNIRNYIDKGSKPSSDVLEKILKVFPRTNPAWLVTGEGEPFLLGLPLSGEQRATYLKNNSGNAVGQNYGTTTQQQGTSAQPSADILTALALAQKEVQLLREQLADKERTIQILLNQKP